MERTGMLKHIDGDSRDYLGERTIFRQMCSEAVKVVVNKGNWFSFSSSKSKEIKQVDLMSVKNNQGKSLGSFVSCAFSESMYRVAIYKYLLHDYLCYVEIPIVKREKDLNGFKNSYNKLIVTSNINVVAEWMGISVEEAQLIYGSRLSTVDVNDDSTSYPYLKLYETKEGERKITRPRSDMDLYQSGMRLVPVFALKAGVDLLYKKLQTGCYDVTFFKDGGQERVINTTFNIEKILSLYEGHEDFVKREIPTIYEGDFQNNPTFTRGYIRVFELGSSVYDTPTRSINYARITSIEEAEPNMSYVGIDLDSVMQEFEDRLYKIKNLDVDEFVMMLEEFDVGTTRTVGSKGEPITSVHQIDTWAKSQHLLLSTVFLRQLALFMIGNPQWFNGYTGKPYVTTNNDNLGESPIDFGGDFSLPLG